MFGKTKRAEPAQWRPNNIACCTLLMLTLSSLAYGANQDQPNILLLVAEDLGPRVGSYGDQHAITPNLDALAQQSTRFTHVFTTAGVCAPSRAALITEIGRAHV